MWTTVIIITLLVVIIALLLVILFGRKPENSPVAAIENSSLRVE